MNKEMENRPKWVDALLGMAVVSGCVAIIIHAVKEALFLYEYFRTY